MKRKNDRDGLIVIALVILALVVLIPMMCHRSGTNGTSSGADSVSNSNKDNGGSYYAQPDQGYGDGSVAQEVSSNAELFPFDPNTADSTTLLRLGLKPWQVRSIYRFRAKGGRYYKREDFSRLYGLSLEHYRRLEPYIQITPVQMARDVINSSGNTSANPSSAASHPANANSSNASAPTTSRPAYTPYPKQDKISAGQTIDINTADTTQLKRIPGIGSYFARRIVELRQRKGAFTSPQQLLSITNFPESSLAYMTASQNFSKIYVNTMTQQQLQQHPLLNYVQARDIINLRRTRGNITSVQQLSFLASFSPELIKQITPLLVFQ